MIDDKRDFIQKKVDAYFLLNERVHITLRTGHWLNGLILEVSAEFCIVDDLMDGKTPVFFQEIKDVSKYTPKGEK